MGLIQPVVLYGRETSTHTKERKKDRVQIVLWAVTPFTNFPEERMPPSSSVTAV